MSKGKQYDMDYKIQTLKLVKEIGTTKASRELGVPINTIYGWISAEKDGRIDIGPGYRDPKSTMTLAEEVVALRKKVREQEKEIRYLKDANEFLEEASAFFAASRQKRAR